MLNLRKTVMDVALNNGFTLRQQEDGTSDLKEYVYKFGELLVKHKDDVDMKNVVGSLKKYLIESGFTPKVKKGDSFDFDDYIYTFAINLLIEIGK